MKILLIYPPRRDDSYAFPPTSLLYIAQAVRSAGHEAEIIDIPYLLEKLPEKYSLLNGSLFDYIINKDCDILGLGGVVSTYFFYDCFVPLYRTKKQNVPIVVGGSVGTPIKEVWAKYAPVDYLVEGDGEWVIQKMLNALEKKDHASIDMIPGVYSLKNGAYQGLPASHSENIDELPFLNYDETDAEYYIDELSRWVEDILPDRARIKDTHIRLLPLLTSRGCPFKCTFCFHFSEKHRSYSIDYVLNNIKFLKNKYNINGLYIIDDLFTFNRKRTIELCERICQEKLNVYFVGSGGKPSLVTADILAAMKKAGFVRFSYGIESGSQRMLDVMQKKTTIDQNFKALKLTEEADIPSFANMVMGMPGENKETLNETKHFLINAGLNTKNFYASWAVAYPGTPLFNWMQNNNMVDDVREYLFEVGSIGHYIRNFSELSRKEVRKAVYILHHEVDMAYNWRHKEYTSFLKNVLAIIIAHIFFIFPPPMQNFLKTSIRNILPPKKQKRTVKKSSLEIEKWIESITISNNHDY